MDTLLLTCHFLFEQKQLSLQSPCSGILWVLHTGSDLFTQPRDKVGLQAHPGATVTTATFLSHTTPPLHPGQDGVAGRAPQYSSVPSEVRLELRVLRELAQASLGAP